MGRFAALLFLTLSISYAFPSSDGQAQALSTFKDCDVCPQMVALPAGQYLMGASQADRNLSDPYSYASETPQHRVTIAYSFAIAQFELTVDEFAAYVAETGAQIGGECQIRAPDLGPRAGRVIGTAKSGKRVALGLVDIVDASFRRPGADVTGKHPATCISRREAVAYLEWLGKKTGKRYRFPTEAEWEYAARAGSTTPFHFGSSPGELCAYGNFADTASPYHARVMARCAEKPSPDMTAPVGSYRPNAWGLHDMIGNAFEFIEDCASENYKGAPVDGSPLRRNGCANFATRGYFFDSPGAVLRSAARCHASDWDTRSNGLTIRVALSLDDTAWDRKQ